MKVTHSQKIIIKFVYIIKCVYFFFFFNFSLLDEVLFVLINYGL
jgi:hypothetical protein